MCVCTQTTDCYTCLCPATATRTTDCCTCLCAQPQTHIQQTAIHVCVPSHRHTYNRLLYMSVYPATDQHTPDTHATDCYTCLCAQPQTHIQQTNIHECAQPQIHTTDCYTCLYAQPQTHILQTNIHMSVCPATDTQTTDCYNVCVHRHTNNRLLYMSVRAATHTTDRYTCLCAQPQTHIQQTAIHVCVHSHRQTYNRPLYMSVCPATDTHTTDCYTCLCTEPVLSTVHVKHSTFMFPQREATKLMAGDINRQFSERLFNREAYVSKCNRPSCAQSLVHQCVCVCVCVLSLIHI